MAPLPGLPSAILIGGAPRAAAILIGTVSAALALGLRLWLPGLLLWIIGHGAAAWLAKRDLDRWRAARRRHPDRHRVGRAGARLAALAARTSSLDHRSWRRCLACQARP